MKKFLNYKNLIVQRSMAIEREEVRDLTVRSIRLSQEYLLDEAIRSSFGQKEPFINTIGERILPPREDEQGQDIVERYQAIVFSSSKIEIEDQIGKYYNEQFYWALNAYPIYDNTDKQDSYNSTYEPVAGEKPLPDNSSINGGWIKQTYGSGDNATSEYKFVIFTLKPKHVYDIKASWSEEAAAEGDGGGDSEEETKESRLVETPYTKSEYVYPMLWAKEFFAEVFSEYITLKLSETLLDGINVKFGDRGTRPIKKHRAEGNQKHDIDALYRSQYAAYYAGEKRVIDLEIDSTMRRRLSRIQRSGAFQRFGGLETFSSDNFEQTYNQILKDDPENADEIIDADSASEIFNVSCYYAKQVSSMLGAISPDQQVGQPIDMSGLNVSISLPSRYDESRKGGAITSVSNVDMQTSKTNFDFSEPGRIQTNTTYLFHNLVQWIENILNVSRDKIRTSGNYEPSEAQENMPDAISQKIQNKIKDVLKQIETKKDRNATYTNIHPSEQPEQIYVNENGRKITLTDMQYLAALEKYLSNLNEVTPKTLRGFNERLKRVNESNWDQISDGEFNLKQLLLED